MVPTRNSQQTRKGLRVTCDFVSMQCIPVRNHVGEAVGERQGFRVRRRFLERY